MHWCHLCRQSRCVLVECCEKTDIDNLFLSIKSHEFDTTNLQVILNSMFDKYVVFLKTEFSAAFEKACTSKISQLYYN